MKLSSCLFIASLPAILLSPHLSAVEDTVWNGSDGDWFDRNDWSAGMPSPSSNAVVPSGSLSLNSYAEARLLRVGVSSSESATFTIDEGATLEMGAAGISQIGVGNSSELGAQVIQLGGRVILGNDLNIGGFLSSGPGRGSYRMEAGILRIHGGDLLLGANTTGSSVAQFEQLGGSVEVEHLVIGPDLYRGMQSATLNRSVYTILDGDLTIAKGLEIGSESIGGAGATHASLRIGSAANITLNGALNLYASKQSQPVLSFILDGEAAGALTVGRAAELKLGGTLQVELPHSVAMLNAREFELLRSQSGSVSGAFDVVENANLWQAEVDADGVRVALSPDAERASVKYASGLSQSFARSSVGYVELSALPVGGQYRCLLNIDPGSEVSLDGLVDSFRSAGFDAEVQSGKYLSFGGRASAETLYFVWDFGNGLSPTKISGFAF